jgi:HAD superfamily hydrolase (TIGR01490 family)
LTIALFDLDHTLIDGDSEVLWGEFLGNRGLVDPREYQREALRFFDLYKSGRLDINEFLEFQLHFLSLHDMATLLRLRAEFVEDKLRQILLPRARALIEDHKVSGHTSVIITASSRFIAEPVAELYGMDGLIATEAEIVDGRYTGRAAGVPSFAAGKVTRVRQWLDSNGGTWAGSWFYSDSHNDLPLLHEVEHPVAVDPDPILAAEAARMGWPVISLLP